MATLLDGLLPTLACGGALLWWVRRLTRFGSRAKPCGGGGCGSCPIPRAKDAAIWTEMGHRP